MAALNLKLPPFWPSDPDLWFVQVEAQFSTRGITSSSGLSLAQICDPDPGPHPPHPRHDTVRHAQTPTHHPHRPPRTTAPPTVTQLHRVGRSETHATSPSHAAGGTVEADAKLIRELFLQRLPSNVRMVLASFGDTKPLEELAELGDNIIAAGPPGVSGVTQPEPSREVEELRSELAQLRERVSTLSTSTRIRSPSPHRRLFRPRSPPPHPTPTSMCWYHARFGDMARKCTPPCSYSGNGKASL